MSFDRDERTEQATPRHLEELAKKGQVAYSRELPAAVLLFLVAGAFRLLGSDVVEPLLALFRKGLSLGWNEMVAEQGIGALLTETTLAAGVLILPLLLTAFATVALCGFLQVGFSFETDRLEWKWERLDVVANAARLFSVKSVVALLLALVKLLIVAWIAWDTVTTLIPDPTRLASMHVRDLAALTADLCLTLAMKTGLFLVVIGGADFFWQRWSFLRDAMMTKQQVKEEHKQQEGDGQVKGRIKQRQREIARMRMMQDVKTATVVIRNPTHFAVALRYVRGKDPAPRVVAKGADLIALRIIAEAGKHGVPCIARPEVARELYRTVKIGGYVPASLFKAVAAILAYVLRRNAKGASA